MSVFCSTGCYITQMFVLFNYLEFYTFDVYNACIVNFVIAVFRATLKKLKFAQMSSDFLVILILLCLKSD